MANRVKTTPMGDNIHLAKLSTGWFVYRIDPSGDLVELVRFDEEDNDDAGEKKARQWVADYFENRAAISQTEGW